MTVSIGTYDDLKGYNESQPIDRNPSIDCHRCGEPHNWQDYWEPRYVDGMGWDPSTVVWWCDECLEAARKEYELEKRKREHKQLTDFTGTNNTFDTEN